MSIVTFDTLKFVETLEKAGVSREQASAMAAAVRDSHEGAELATKGDLRELDTGLRHEIKLLEQRMTIKLGSMLVIAVGVFAAIVKLL
ncbi:DUF1640 domain-containing protein [Bordetella avium]|uniref:DUF1640 domain-containing protein n=1 Tax=Bordetella avium TaxID=521 RepID=UPI000E685E07|nr:DUF1640 domain-containing protein [Bordetella avium]RIQ64359.1 DUF1640 domain-containing protein [Bordetella avium]